MNTIKEVAVAIVPLVQSLVWVAFIAWIFYYLRDDLKLLQVELQRRIKSGEQIESGPLRLQKVEEKVTNVEQDVNKSYPFRTAEFCH